MKRVLERRKVERIMKNDTRKTVRGLLIAGVVAFIGREIWYFETDGIQCITE